MRVLVLTSLMACADGTGGSDTDTDPAPVAEICEGAPPAQWDDFGAGFVTQHCQVCHASTSPDRHGAPSQVVFDTEEDVWANAEEILERATGEAPTMPPEGGVSPDDRYLLEVWLSCSG